ncbi:hypothetical protein [Caulifigura coniformis]|nr:hypothetical protein [Caulifigura coniformis]
MLVNGAVTGTIQSIDSGGAVRVLSDITVSFYRNGSLSAQALPAPDGTFTARLSPGSYTLVAYGPGGYCTYGLEAVGNPNDLTAASQIESLAIPPSDFGAAHSIARRYAGRSSVGPVPTVADTSLVQQGTQAEGPETSLKHHTVTIEPDGGVPGRLNLSKSGNKTPMTAFLVRDGAIVKQTSVSSDGSFRFLNVSPGNYSFVTAGAAGFSAYSVVVGGPLALHATR